MSRGRSGWGEIEMSSPGDNFRVFSGIGSKSAKAVSPKADQITFHNAWDDAARPIFGFAEILDTFSEVSGRTRAASPQRLKKRAPVNKPGRKARERPSALTAVGLRISRCYSQKGALV